MLFEIRSNSNENKVVTYIRSHATEQGRRHFTFDEGDGVALTARAVVLRDFHQTQRRILFLYERLDK